MKPPKFLFNHQVIIRGFVGNDSSGNKVYTAITTIDPSMILSNVDGNLTIKCRFEPKITTSRGSNQDDKTYVGTLFTFGTDIPTQSTVIFENKKYIVGECIKHYDLNGISYLEVLLT